MIQIMNIVNNINYLSARVDHRAGKEFIGCSEQDQLTNCDQIAYPKKTKLELREGMQFFTRMRNLTPTGYFTSEMGVEELGYKGITPNVWDRIP